jgi:hypothetical protein
MSVKVDVSVDPPLETPLLGKPKNSPQRRGRSVLSSGTIACVGLEAVLKRLPERSC